MESLLQVGGGGQPVLEATGGGGQRLKSVSHTYIQGERGAQQQVDSPEEVFLICRVCVSPVRR